MFPYKKTKFLQSFSEDVHHTKRPKRPIFLDYYFLIANIPSQYNLSYQTDLINYLCMIQMSFIE